MSKCTVVVSNQHKCITFIATVDGVLSVTPTLCTPPSLTAESFGRTSSFLAAPCLTSLVQYIHFHSSARVQTFQPCITKFVSKSLNLLLLAPPPLQALYSHNRLQLPSTKLIGQGDSMIPPQPWTRLSLLPYGSPLSHCLLKSPAPRSHILCHSRLSKILYLQPIICFCLIHKDTVQLLLAFSICLHHYISLCSLHDAIFLLTKQHIKQNHLF